MSYEPLFGARSLRRRWSEGMLRAACACGLLGVLTGCGSDPMTATAKRVQATTVAPGAKPFPVAVRRTEYSVEASWIVETDSSWADYTSWLQPRLEREFTLVEAAEDGMILRRISEGDVFTLQVRRIAADPALRVRFTLHSEAY